VILIGKDCRALFIFTFEMAHGILFIQTGGILSNIFDSLPIERWGIENKVS